MPSRLLRASVVGALAGGAAGFALGLLLAPQEGRHTRDRVAYLLDRWSGQISVLIDRLGAHDGPRDARETADALVADARQQADQLLHEAEALMSEARQRRSGR